MGRVPDTYELYRAAKYMGVAPWDLLERETIWRDLALMFERAELQAQRDVARRQQRRGKQSGGR